MTSSWSDKEIFFKLNIKTAKYNIVMPFEMNLPLEDINPDWAKKRSGYRKIAEVIIRFVFVVSSYDTKPTNSNSFSMSLHLSSTPKVKITKSLNKSGEEVTKKEF